MKIIDRGIDGVVKKISGKETIRIEPEQLLQIVQEEFISFSDMEQLKTLLKMSKGPFFGKKIMSVNGRYSFMVGGMQQGALLGVGRSVWIEDFEKKVFYQIYDRKWKKFKKMLLKSVNDEIIARRN